MPSRRTELWLSCKYNIDICGKTKRSLQTGVGEYSVYNVRYIKVKIGEVHSTEWYANFSQKGMTGVKDTTQHSAIALANLDCKSKSYWNYSTPLRWNQHISTHASSAANKLKFLFRARKDFQSFILLLSLLLSLIIISQVKLSLHRTLTGISNPSVYWLTNSGGRTSKWKGSLLSWNW